MSAEDHWMKPIDIVELFSGAGGFSALLDRGRFTVTGALDHDPVASRVYSKNRPETRMHNVDITTMRDFSAFSRNPDILLAGPPCQGFSLVGMKTKSALSTLKGYNPSTDPRNLLPLDVSRAAAQLRPKAVILENVPAMRGHVITVDRDEGTVSSLIAQRLGEAGYTVTEPVVVDANEVGVPQHRKRAFIIATLGVSIGPRDIIAAIGRLDRGNFKDTIGKSIWDLLDVRSAGPSDSKQEFPDHVARIPNADDLRIIRHLRPGEDYGSLVERMPEVLSGRTHKAYRTDSFRDKFYRLRWDKPSKTIVAHLQKDGNSFIHPFLDRSISVREAARLQSFPDSFVFGVPMGHSYRLVGNAVPPLVGKFLVETVSKAMGLLNESEAESMSFASLLN